MNAKKQNNNLLIFLIGSIVAIGPLSIDMYLPGFLTMSHDFGVTEQKLSYTLTSYFAGFAIGQLFYGPILDRFGRKKPLIIGMMIYMVASIVLSMATSLSTFVVFRFIQALGASSGVVSSFSIIRDKFDGANAAKILSSVVLVMGAAPIFAPMMGSYFTGNFGWRYIFYFLAFFSIFIALMVRFLLHNVKEADPNAAFELKSVARNYWSTLKNRVFISYNLAGSFAMAIMFAYISSISYILLTMYEVSNESFSILFGLNAFGFIMGGQANRFLLRWIEVKTLTYIAVGVAIALSITFMIVTSFGMPSIPTLSALLVSVLFTTGFINPNTTALSLDSVDEHIGLASALTGSTRMILGAVVSIIIGSIHEGVLQSISVVFVAFSTLTLVTILIANKYKPEELKN